MERYKLIKLRTPDDFPVGTIAQIINGYTTIYDSEEKIKLKDGYGNHWVKNYPKFWERISEETYEILAFKANKSTPSIWKRDTQLKDQYCLDDGISPFRSLEFFLCNTGSYSIDSIKRLSDGKIFTLGDRVITKNNSKVEEILKITISRGNKQAYIDTQDCRGCSIETVIKVANCVPEKGQQYKHKNGNIYTVILITNEDSTEERQQRHPKDVVYMGQNGKVWSRRLDDWGRSFTKI